MGSIDDLCSQLQLAADKGLVQLLTVLGLGLGIRVPPFYEIIKAQQPAPAVDVDLTFESTTNIEEIVASVLRVGQQHRQHLDALASALQANDVEQLRTAAHTLVGGAVCQSQ